MTDGTHSFEQVLEMIRDGARTETQKGERFERLMTRVLPLFAETDCDRVVARADLSTEQAAWLRIPANDTGIDLIGFSADDPDGKKTGAIAIQCKCYDGTTSITKDHLNSFLAHGGNDRIKKLLWVDTSVRPLSRNLETVTASTGKWQRIGRDRLERSTIDWATAVRGRPAKKPLQLNGTQRDAVSKITTGLEAADRGQCLMACGTGKTLVGQRVAEALTGPEGRILVLVPSRALLKQMLENWSDNSAEGLSLCAVCADASVRNDLYPEDLQAGEIDCPVTTRPDEIADAWQRHTALGRRSVTIATYQSSGRIAEAQAGGGGGVRFGHRRRSALHRRCRRRRQPVPDDTRRQPHPGAEAAVHDRDAAGLVRGAAPGGRRLPDRRLLDEQQGRVRRSPLRPAVR